MPKDWSLLTVIRATPPEYGKCREPTCARPIEWVRTTTGKSVPVDLPLVIDRLYERHDGSFVTVIHDDAVHWRTCKARHAADEETR
jgi:hypothetical protein